MNPKLRHHNSKSKLKSSPSNAESSETSNRISNGPNVYQIGAEIGRGGFAVVFQAFNLQTGDFVAVKRFPLHTIDDDSLSSIEGEIELMQKLNHPNIVKYIDTIRTKSHLFIVLEYVENGSLSNVIKKFGSFSESLTAIYITQVLRGLKYLHEQGVLHRDIKGANILTTKDGMVKLADFGVAMKMSEDHVDEQDVVGSPYWIAPEIIEMSAPTTACDIWSLGCIVVELLTGKPPYFDLQPMAALFRIVQDDYPPLPEGISQALRDFLQLCFQKEPMMRSTAEKLLEHPWLRRSPSTNLAHTSQLLQSRSVDVTANRDADNIVMNTIRMYQREISPVMEEESEKEKEKEKREKTVRAIEQGLIPALSSSISGLRESYSNQSSLPASLNASTESHSSAGSVQSDTVGRHGTVSSRARGILQMESKNFQDSEDFNSSSLGSGSKSNIQQPQNSPLPTSTPSLSMKRSAGSKDIISIPPDDFSDDSDATKDNGRNSAVVMYDTISPGAQSHTLDFEMDDDNDNWDSEFLDDDFQVDKPMPSSNQTEELKGKTTFERPPIIPSSTKSSSRPNSLSKSKSTTSPDPSFQNSFSGSRPRVNSASDSIGASLSLSRSTSLVGGSSGNSQYFNQQHTNAVVSLASSVDAMHLSNRSSSKYILNPHQSSFMLMKYQENPEEEDDFDDFLEDSSGKDKSKVFPSKSSQNVHAMTHSTRFRSVPRSTSDTIAEKDFEEVTSVNDVNLSEILNKYHSPKAAKHALASESFDDISSSADMEGFSAAGEDPSPTQTSGSGFASALRQRMQKRAKEVIDDDSDDFINYQFDDKDFKQNEHKDVHFRRSREVVDIMEKIRTVHEEEEVIDLCEQLMTIFADFPEQREHLVTYHGVMPIIDMFEAESQLGLAGLHSSSKNSNLHALRPYVLRVINTIIEGSIRAQEQLSLVGIIPTIMNLFERSCKNNIRAKLISFTPMFRTSTTASKDDSVDSSRSQGNTPVDSDSSTVRFKRSTMGNFVDDRDFLIDPVTLETARFIHQISSTSSLTLQMLIGAGGLSVLTSMVAFGVHILPPPPKERVSDVNKEDLMDQKVSVVQFEKPKSEKPRSMMMPSLFLDTSAIAVPELNLKEKETSSVHEESFQILQMGIDCITQVFSVQSSRTRDFCRLFVKLQLLPQLSVAFQNVLILYQEKLNLRSSPHHSRNSSSGASTALLHAGTQGGVPSKNNNHRRNVSNGSTGLDSNSSYGSFHESDDCVERKYANLIANLFFTFSRSDAVVVEQMVNNEYGLITVILSALRAQELRGASTGLNIENWSNHSSFCVAPSLSQSNLAVHNSTSGMDSARRKAMGLRPAYVEIIEILLKCLKNLSMEPSSLADLETAGTIETLIPLLKGPIAERCKNLVMPCIFNLCRINKRRQELAATRGIIPHLIKVVKDGSHLRSFALPVLFDLAHTSAITRQELWNNDCVTFYLDQLKESYWQTFALNSLAIWLASDTDDVSKLLVESTSLGKLIDFFRAAATQTIRVLHKPLLDMMLKSEQLVIALSTSTLYVGALLKRLKNTSEAIVLRSLLTMLQLLHQNHPSPTTFVKENGLYALVQEFARSEVQVLVCQLANRLLKDFESNNK